MTDTPGLMTSTPVRKSVVVRATPARAFHVFTSELDSWWPRTHHIGSSPMQRAILEPHVGGRCYSQQEDGSECDWASVLAWEPPHRFVLAWQITPEWKYEPDLAKSSEVEVRFRPEGEGRTRVDLEHRLFERHGAGFESMKSAVDSPGGWFELLQLFSAKAEQGS